MKMRITLLATVLFICSGLVSEPNVNNEYEKYQVLVTDMPSAKLMILQNRSLDITKEELRKIEIRLNTIEK